MNGRKEHEGTEYASQSLCLSVQVSVHDPLSPSFDRLMFNFGANLLLITIPYQYVA